MNSYLSLTPAWCGKGAEGESTPVVTKEDIACFREGNFIEASENIKEKWCMVMLDLLPSIGSMYTKLIRAESLATEVTTVSDEAILLWWLHLYGRMWSKEAEMNKKLKTEGEHHSRTEMNLFYGFFSKVFDARKDPVEGVGWDTVLKQEAIRRLSIGKNGQQKGGTGEWEDSQAPKLETAVYVTKYSPGKSMRVEKMLVPV